MYTLPCALPLSKNFIIFNVTGMRTQRRPSIAEIMIIEGVKVTTKREHQRELEEAVVLTEETTKTKVLETRREMTRQK